MPLLIGLTFLAGLAYAVEPVQTQTLDAPCDDLAEAEYDADRIAGDW